ncbi:PREDICTED: uncharacterized protein LOC108614299 isoform X1 [Drosophila arizonae]|uniref:Uncharacterized protein LOC108614299 isoform X1 n=1 Tax=Drosophila arizonae TaxID=7263 RepID=A0ABM1P9F6_DROAR|nr:PREDICTED: uncharacterized protein LOC108614299 isoform X1 [Drosophila arizonae]
MFNATRCCGCWSLLIGCYLIAFVTFVYSVLSIQFVLIFHTDQYSGDRKGTRGDYDSFICFVVPEVILFLASCSLVLYGLFRKKFLVFIYVGLVGPHIVYFILMFLITTAIGINMIINRAGDNVHIFWPFCLFRFDPGHTKGSTEDHTSMLLHLVPELLIVLSSLLLILYEMCPRTAYVITFVCINGVHIIYFIIITIVAVLIRTNIIVNYAGLLIHLYWPLCVLRTGITIYSIYIVISYCKQRRKEM